MVTVAEMPNRSVLRRDASSDFAPILLHHFVSLPRSSLSLSLSAFPPLFQPITQF